MAGATPAEIKKWAMKLETATAQFAVALPTNKIEDIQIAFDRRVPADTLARGLKKATKADARKLASGTARMGPDPGTLVLELDGKAPPGLAKRLKKMLKGQGVSKIKKVALWLDGAEVESADDASLEAEEEQVAGGGTSQPAPDLKTHLKEIAARAQQAEESVRNTVLPLLKSAIKETQSGNAEAATGLVTQIEETLAAETDDPIPLVSETMDLRLSAALQATPDNVRTKKDIEELRRDVRRARKAVEKGALSPQQVAALETELTQRLARMTDADPLFDEVANLSASLFDKGNTEQLRGVLLAIRDAYEKGSSILEAFAERQQLARADGHIEMSIFTQEVGARLSRQGEWRGVPGNSPWSPRKPEILQQMLARFETIQTQIAKDPKLAEAYGELELDDFTQLPFKDGYPDFTKFVEGGPSPASPGRALIASRDFVLPDPARFKTHKARMSAMRDHHFRLADESFARKSGWLDADGAADTARATAYRSAKGLTWHHVENSTELQLVPTWLHAHIPHDGGIATGGGL